MMNVFPAKIELHRDRFPDLVAKRIAQDDRIKFLHRLPRPRVDFLIREMR